MDLTASNIALLTAILGPLSVLAIAIWGKRASGDKKIDENTAKRQELWARITELERQLDEEEAATEAWREKYFNLRDQRDNQTKGETKQ